MARYMRKSSCGPGRRFDGGLQRPALAERACCSAAVSVPRPFCGVLSSFCSDCCFGEWLSINYVPSPVMT
jgi:hypothetical protein